MGTDLKVSTCFKGDPDLGVFMNMGEREEKMKINK